MRLGYTGGFDNQGLYDDDQDQFLFLINDIYVAFGLRVGEASISGVSCAHEVALAPASGLCFLSGCYGMRLFCPLRTKLGRGDDAGVSAFRTVPSRGV